MNLKEKLTEKKAVLSVIGLGYVGLPLAVQFARAGFKTVGVDISADKVDKVNSGKSYIGDVSDEELREVIGKGMLRATTEFGVLKEVDTINICVPTPLRKTKDPDISYIVASVKEIKEALHAEQLITLESTTYPGTTEEVILPILEETGLKVGKDFYLAFSPERVDPGNENYKTKDIPKVVGGITEASTELAVNLYKMVGMNPIPVSSSKVAETVKLLENTFRSVNIGLVNEIALMCNKMGIDVWEVIDAAATKPFGFMPFYPGPGLGGHCIPIDPFYLSWKARMSGFEARFIELSGMINGEMPLHVVHRVADALNDQGKCLKGTKILIMGVSYKADIDDTRESPAFDIINLLQQRGTDVYYYDSYVENLVGVEGVKRIDYNGESIKGMDCAIIVTGHHNVDYGLLLDNCPLIFDSRNVFKGVKKDNIVKL
ncbi:MAG: UDP-N-acetyl-D-glucosamine dehydrogenase [Candidatus Latescibacteria bacterium 4484_7]|nr:MAG: UDP-N-acetyl-D-glucosamine dehydrogenase [Candidatus Latescibacteria bacterium 4484_7]